MALIGSKKSTSDLEKDLEYLKLEREICTEEATIQERKVVISELKKQYGTDWRKILGAGKLPSLSTLRGFLRGSKQGLEGLTGKFPQ